jgi:outer membrane protein assembly factor BamB
LVIAASSDGQIHAFDRTTGSIEWSLPAADNSLEGVPSRSQDFRALTRSGGTLFAGSLSGLVIAYDLQTQRRKWVYRGYGSTGFRIASDGANVYVPNLSGHLTGLDALTGAEVWRVGGSEAGFIWAPAVLGAGRFLVSGLQELSAFGW